MHWSELIGKKYGRLTVLRRSNGMGVCPVIMLCRCDCGNETRTSASHIKNGHSKSCGCFSIENRKERAITHGKTHSRTYRIWTAMLRRCYNKNCQNYKWYGARGIRVCKEWRKDFSAFLRDMGEAPHKMEIDRINVNGNYIKSNCRWVTHQQNCQNRRSSRAARI